MEKAYKTCCVVGQRPHNFPWEYTKDPANGYDSFYESILKRAIKQFISEGYDRFLCSGIIGGDMDFVEEVLFLRDYEFPHIKVELVIPYRNQQKNWSTFEKMRYRQITKLVDEVTIISEKYTDFCYPKCNQYKVDNSDCVFLIWNGEERGGIFSVYMQGVLKGKPIRGILLDEIINYLHADPEFRALQEESDKDFDIEPCAPHKFSKESKKKMNALIEQFGIYYKRREAKRVQRDV